jgi:hypothetical protein
MTPHGSSSLPRFRSPRPSRRAFLQGLGVGSLLVPMLDADRARAAAQAKRLVVIGVPNGVREKVYWPTGGENDWTIPADADVDPAERYSPLLPLLPHKKDVTFIGGITLRNGRDSNGGSLGGHGSMPFLLTGARGVPGPKISDGITKSAAVPSVDQFIAREQRRRHGLPFASLVMSPLAELGNDRYLSFYGPPLDPSTPNAPAPKVDPIGIYTELFAGQALGDEKLRRTLRDRRSVLDVLSGELRHYGERLGTEDRKKIDAHMESVRAIERQLDFAFAGGCKAPALEVDPSKNYLANSGSPLIAETLKAQLDMTVAAFACDATRVASMLWSNSTNVRWVYHWLGADFTKAAKDFASTVENQGLRNQHEIAHRDGEAEFRPLMNRVCQWYLEQLAYLIARLKATPDVGGKTLFDSSALLYMNMQRTGGGHNTDNLPWILAGSAGGYLKPGRFLPWPSGTTNKGVAQNGILVALANAMDVPVPWYGSPDYGGELTSLRG